MQIALVALSFMTSTTNALPSDETLGKKITATKTTTDKKTKSGWRVKGTFTATNGCVFTVDGDYSLLGGFTGIVKIGCPGKPSQTYVFEFVVNNNSLEYISGDIDAWDAYIGNDTSVQSEIITILNDSQ